MRIEKARTSLWPIGALYSLLALAATLLNSTNWYIGDNRFEQYVNPARRLAKSFGVWDPTRGLGAPREDAWPGTTIPGGIMRALGFSPWVGERVFHAICIATMALGVVAVLRLFRPRIGLEHLLAGLYAGFGPYTAAFLLPTNLYYMMALGPWLVVILAKGFTSDHPYRWAAAFALVIAWAGNPDFPGLAYNAVILVIAALYLVGVERVARVRDAVKWAAAAIGLSILCSAWTIAKTIYARDMLNARLVDTELPAVSALTSSWSETLRGLGNWLSYFRTGGGLVKPQDVSYFSNALVVAATFIVPMVALFALWRVKWRGKLLFTIFALVSGAVVVSGFKSPTASPIGASILWLMEHVTVISSFRNTYKAGGGIVIGVAVLAGMGVAAARDALAPRGKWWGRLPAAASAVVLLGVSFPFWTGNLYQPSQQVIAVPGYWTSAFHYLDALPDNGLTAVVPAITRADYRWGWVGDDIFDALLTRRHTMATGVPLSNPLGAASIEAFTLATQADPYQPGVAGAIARRIGITEVVIRNDLNWETLALPRPSRYDGLRNDPDFELVATFGTPGDEVPYTDHSNDGIRERRLAPVEIYRVKSATSLVRTADTAPMMLVGDADAWGALQTNGVVSSTQALTVSGGVSDASVTSTVERSSAVIVSDTGRRRLRRLIDYEPTYSYTLGPTTNAGRIVRELFPDVPSAEATAWFPDATDVNSIASTVSDSNPWERPANLFDGDLSTSWAVDWSLSPAHAGVKVSFRSPQTISRVTMWPTRSFGAFGKASVQQAEIRLSDGSVHLAHLDFTGKLVATFPATTTTSLSIVMTQIDRLQTLVGFEEVQIPGVNLDEFVQPGTDLFGDRGDVAGLAAAVASKPTAYSFQRANRTGYQLNSLATGSRFDEEHSLSRRFDVAHPAEYTVAGTVQATGLVGAADLGSVIGGAITAQATGSDPTDSNGQPLHAVDGDLTTAWISQRSTGDTLTIGLPSQPISQVMILSDADGPAEAVKGVTVTVGDEVHHINLQPDPWCPAVTLADVAEQKKAEQAAGPQKFPCYRRGVVLLGHSVTAGHVDVRIDTVDKRANPFGLQAHLDEVQVSGPSTTPSSNTVQLDRSVDVSCADFGLRVGADADTSKDAIVPISFHATVRQLLSGAHIPFTACVPAKLVTGTNFLDTVGRHWIDSAVLTSPDFRTVAAVAIAPTVSAVPAQFEGPGVLNGTVDLATSRQVVLAQSFDPLWTLSVDGGSAEAALPIDGLDGWIVPAGHHRLVFRFAPEFGNALAVDITIAGIVLCIGLLVGRRRRPAVRTASADITIEPALVGTPAKSVVYGAIGVATLIGVGLVGPLALLVGAATLALAHYMAFDDAVDVTGAAAPVLVTIAALLSTILVVSSDAIVSLAYPKARSSSHHLTLVAMVFALQTVALLAVSLRAAEPRVLVREGRDALRTRLASLTASLRSHAALVGAVAVGVAVRGVTAAASKPTAGVDQLVRNILMGTKYTTSAVGGTTAVDLAPFAPVARAATRMTPAVLGCIAFVCTVLLVVDWSRRRAALPAWQIAAVCVLSPLSWGLSLGGQLAAMTIAATIWLLDRDDRRASHVMAAGLALTAAVLARPDAVVAAVVVVALLARRREWRHVATVIVELVLGVAAWANTVWSAGGAPWLAGSLRAMVIDDAARGIGHVLPWWVALAIAIVVVLVLGRRHSPASDR